MTLAPSQIIHFLDTGYLTLEGFFTSTEVQAMQCEVERWLREDLPRDVSTNPEQRQNLQLIPLFPLSALFRSLPFSPKVVTATEALIGKPVIKILDQMFYKPAHTGMGTSWHTDNAYFKLADPLKGVAMWIAIHDATKENGTLKIVPRAFREDFPHSRDPASDHHICTRLDERRAVHCELKAGGVVFFCFGTPHATSDNLSTSGRAGAGIHFVNRSCMNGPLENRWQRVQITQQNPRPGDNENRERPDFHTEVERVLRTVKGHSMPGELEERV